MSTKIESGVNQPMKRPNEETDGEKEEGGGGGGGEGNVERLESCSNNPI